VADDESGEWGTNGLWSASTFATGWHFVGVNSGRKTCIVDRATKFTPSIHASKTTCDGVTTGPSGQVIALSRPHNLREGKEECGRNG